MVTSNIPGVPGAPGAPVPGMTPSAPPADAPTASFAPDDAVEGGGPPVGQRLTIREARIDYYDYNGKAPQTVASKLTLVGQDGQSYVQFYSIGDPSRFMPSTDHKRLHLLAGSSGVSKSCNHMVLVTAMVNLDTSGTIANLMKAGDFSAIEGMDAYWDGVPEPSRPGLNRTEQQRQRQNVILVPTQIYALPGQTAPPAPPAPAPVDAPVAAPVAAAPVPPPPAPAPAAPPAAPPTNGTVDLNSLGMGLVALLGNAFTLQQVTQQCYSQYADLGQHPYRDTLAQHIFTPEFAATLQANGYQVNGPNVTK